MNKPNILIGGQENPANGWAIIFAGGSASGKSTLIRDGRLLFEGEVLSTDTAGEEIIDVHNQAARYAKEDPARLKEAEKLVKLGCANRYGKVCEQNIHLDLACTTWGIGKMSTVLSNGAHAIKEQTFRRHIKAAADNDHQNLLLDMTGKEKEVKLYTEVLREAGYKVALVWVIANRTQAMIWNLLRARAMKVDAVHGGHDDPNKYLLQYLMDSRSAGLDDAWLIMNTTESPLRPMTEEEEKASAVRLQKDGDHFIVPEELESRVKKIIWPLSPKAAGNSETPQWQMDETGKKPLLVDDAFMEKYTREVVLADGTTGRALLQLRAANKPKEGGLLVYDDNTKEPKLQKCNEEDTPTYPYVLITKDDYGKKIQRRHGNTSRYKLKTEKAQADNIVKMISDTATYKFMDRIKMMRKIARQKGIAEPRYEEVLFSVQKDDEKKVEEKIKQFYKDLNMKEPELPAKPVEAYPVNEPVREQFSKEADYEAAKKAYPSLKAAYETALEAWNVYNEQFK